jgi:hypothetical protein
MLQRSFIEWRDDERFMPNQSLIVSVRNKYRILSKKVLQKKIKSCIVREWITRGYTPV